MKTERRASLEKPNVPVEIVGANRRPKSGREESVASIFREDRGSGGGMRAKDRGVNTGDPAQCGGASQSNRRSVRIGAGLSWESERSIVAVKRVMIVERGDLSSRATLEVTRGKRLAPRPSNLVKPRQLQTTFNGLERRRSLASLCARAPRPLSESRMRDPQVRFDERDLETEPSGYRARSRLYPRLRLRPTLSLSFMCG